MLISILSNKINKKYWRNISVLFLISLFFLLAGCQIEVHKGLSESEANLMLSTLLKRGISVEKKAQGKAGFAVLVDESDLVRTLEILQTHSLPREEFQSLGKVFSGQGMIASPSEEQVRMSFAISQELSDTFSRVDGVLTARAHVVLTKYDQASDTTTLPSAAIFLRHTQESPVINMVPKIKELTAKAVPGLDYEKVSVMLVPVREDVTVPQNSVKKTFIEAHRSILVITAVFIVILLGVFFFLYKKGWRIQNNTSVNLTK